MEPYPIHNALDMVAVRVDQEGGVAGWVVIDQRFGRAGVAAGRNAERR